MSHEMNARRLTPTEIAEKCFTEFNDRVHNLDKEEYWEAAGELSAMLEGILMEKEESSDEERDK